MTSDSPSQPPHLPLPVILVGLVLLGLGMFAAHYLLAPHQAKLLKKPAHYLVKSKPLGGFELIDYNHKPFNAARFDGKWTFLYFGYTNCPDVCPTTLLMLKSVFNKFPASEKSGTSTQMVFVTVDPKRDTPARLKKYVTFYRPNFLGVTGQLDQIDILSKQVGVAHSITPDPNGKGYTVQHGAQIILVDPTGRERAVFSPPQKVNGLLHGYLEIRHYYEQVNS